jgi:hypothetical protein
MALEDIAPGVFGQFPDMSGSLSPEQIQAINSNAAKQALLASAVTMLGMSGQQRVPVSTGQAIGAALGAGAGGYQSSFDNTLKQMIAGQQMQEYKSKADARRKYEQALAGATTRQPIGTGLTRTGVGSQAQMLADQMEGFGEEGTQSVIRALQSNPNLPMRETVDAGKANQAALDYLRDTDKAKYLELTATKPEAVPAAIKEYQFAVGQGYKGTFQDFQLAQKSAGAPRTIVDMTGGQKGFDNEMGLKKAFSQEPVYKAYGEMQSAYGQITDSLKAKSPAGDLAAATKFMKLLDPGSVVRESELGMAMAASGALDRAKNYAQMRISGTKLTEDQRKDFEKLSTDLFSTATGAYNQKRGEFEQMGADYGLNANRALGAPAKMPSKNIKVNY